MAQEPVDRRVVSLVLAVVVGAVAALVQSWWAVAGMAIVAFEMARQLWKEWRTNRRCAAPQDGGVAVVREEPRD